MCIIYIKQFKEAFMFSFLIVVMIFMASCLHSLAQDVIKNNGKHFIK